MKSILGGANGKLKCNCGELRYPGVPACPKCYYGESFDPIIHAQGEKRAELIRAGETDPQITEGVRRNAFNYAKWLVSQGYCGWGLAYKKAAKKYGIPEDSIRQIGAARAATKTTGQSREPIGTHTCLSCNEQFRAKRGGYCKDCDRYQSR